MRNLTYYRLKKGCSVEVLADLLSVSINDIYRWEKGNKLPPDNIIIQLASLFNINDVKFLRCDLVQFANLSKDERAKNNRLIIKELSRKPVKKYDRKKEKKTPYKYLSVVANNKITEVILANPNLSKDALIDLIYKTNPFSPKVVGIGVNRDQWKLWHNECNKRIEKL